jgi:uncharacterized iron-regulated protein
MPLTILRTLSTLALSAAVLAGCAATNSVEPVVPALLVGEQHDAPEHQQLHRDLVDALARRGVLAAVVVEMAERGRSTTGLAGNADEAAVKHALSWRDRAWPWANYGPAVMAAVRAGVPVLGGNLTDAQMRAAREDAKLETLVPAQVLQATRDAIRAGHCDMLPAAQLGPMARIQIARDRALAATVAEAAVPGRTVVLIAGAGHVDPAVGVPLHLPRGLHAQPVLLPRVDTGTDYCGELRKQLPRKD